MTAIVVGYNHGPYLRRCLDALTSQRGLTALEIIYLDNASQDSSLDIAAQYPQIQVIKNDQNLGFAAAVNLGLIRAAGRFTALVNPDTYLPPDALSQLALDLVERQGSSADPVGLVGPTLLSEDGREQQSLCHFPTLTGLFQKRMGFTPKRAWLIGALVVARTRLLRAIGGLDERYFVYGEDMELSHQVINRGHQVMLDRRVRVHHAGNLRWDADRLVRVYGGYLRFVCRHHPRQRMLLGVLLSLRWLLTLIKIEATTPSLGLTRGQTLRRGLERMWSQRTDLPHGPC